MASVDLLAAEATCMDVRSENTTACDRGELYTMLQAKKKHSNEIKLITIT
jgi:hypothetical protein